MRSRGSHRAAQAIALAPIQHGRAARRRALAATAALLLLVLSGCKTLDEFLRRRDKPASVQEAANVYVSAYPAVAWADIASKLEPKNNLTIDQARGFSAVTT